MNLCVLFNDAINKHIVTIFTVRTCFSCYVLRDTYIRRLNSCCQVFLLKVFIFPFFFLGIPKHTYFNLTHTMHMRS